MSPTRRTARAPRPRGRGHIELWHPGDGEPAEIPAAGWPAGTEATVLSRDPGDGALTATLELPAGYWRRAGHVAAESDLLILGGSIAIGGVERGVGHYEYHPAGSGQQDWVVGADGAEVFVKLSGVPDFVPDGNATPSGDAIVLETAQEPWMITPVEGPPPGIVVKLLRQDERTGEIAAIVANPPQFDYPNIEFHDCIEEMYCIVGDMRLGNSGLMQEGSYFWRPAYITHGPFYSATGTVMFLWTSSTLINHFVDDPRQTPAQNRAQAREEARAASGARS